MIKEIYNKHGLDTETINNFYREVENEAISEDFTQYNYEIRHDEFLRPYTVRILAEYLTPEERDKIIQETAYLNY